MLKIKDHLKLDAEELKTALMHQVDEYRQQFDALLVDPKIADEHRLAGLKAISSYTAAILNFLTHKAGIEIRTAEGSMLCHEGYYMAKMMDVKWRISSTKEDQNAKAAHSE